MTTTTTSAPKFYDLTAVIDADGAISWESATPIRPLAAHEAVGRHLRQTAKGQKPGRYRIRIDVTAVHK
jgi:hypothetical protein